MVQGRRPSDGRGGSKLDERLTPATRQQDSSQYVGGVAWTPGVPPAQLRQEILELTPKDAETLRSADRLARLRSAAALSVGPKARPVLVEATGAGQTPRLIITGGADGTMAIKEALETMLCKNPDKISTVHNIDTGSLRKPTRAVVEDLERASGCRLVVEDERSKKGIDDENLSRKCKCVHLIGDPQAQARALRLLEPHSMRSTVMPAAEYSGLGVFQGFSPQGLGVGLELVDGDRLTVRQKLRPNKSAPVDCVATGDGSLRTFALGSFFAIRVRKVDTDPKLKGGTRLGFTDRLVALPPPPTLLTKPTDSWSLGRGFVRGPVGNASKEANRKAASLSIANFDDMQEGEELGALITQETGAVVLFRRKAAAVDWDCVLHWQAGIPSASRSRIFVLLELGGRLKEIEYINRQPPDSFDRPPDVPRACPSVGGWPERPAASEVGRVCIGQGPYMPGRLDRTS